jgi:hypothetical protein
MNLKTTDMAELHSLGRAFSAIVFVLWSVFPMFVLGWLVSAVGRHPSAETAIKEEPVYAFILWWQGGIKMMGPTLLLILFFVLLLVLGYILKKSGYSASDEGMEPARPLVQKLLLPSFLSASAFGCGVLSKGSIEGILASSLLLVLFGVFAGVVHYITDTTKN